jgi:hypothetical protein
VASAESARSRLCRLGRLDQASSVGAVEMEELESAGRLGSTAGGLCLSNADKVSASIREGALKGARPRALATGEACRVFTLTTSHFAPSSTTSDQTLAELPEAPPDEIRELLEWFTALANSLLYVSRLLLSSSCIFCNLRRALTVAIYNRALLFNSSSAPSFILSIALPHALCVFASSSARLTLSNPL